MLVITSGSLKNEVLDVVQARKNDPSFHVKFVKAIVYCGNTSIHSAAMEEYPELVYDVTAEIRDLPKLMNKIIDEIERKKVMENFKKARIASQQ